MHANLEELSCFLGQAFREIAQWMKCGKTMDNCQA